ncbi:YraN family protein [Hugenholtzia roseola]|uniref:YraN family protein n=1 Tax=Hugenholtzia roseola TaxID=1002 RepID=UPI0004195EA2|nr:YraN family protein [Hugenholtzia roseola]
MPKSKANTQSLGKEGEARALSFLLEKGYKLVAQNFRAGRGEIDLIVCKGEILAFVEVKQRKNDDFGNPEAFVSAKQVDKILQTAETFLEQNPWQGAIRFDILAILTEKNELLHLEDAF